MADDAAARRHLATHIHKIARRAFYPPLGLGRSGGYFFLTSSSSLFFRGNASDLTTEEEEERKEDTEVPRLSATVFPQPPLQKTPVLLKVLNTRITIFHNSLWKTSDRRKCL
jgi:hypothetical protein